MAVVAAIDHTDREERPDMTEVFPGVHVFVLTVRFLDLTYVQLSTDFHVHVEFAKLEHFEEPISLPQQFVVCADDIYVLPTFTLLHFFFENCQPSCKSRH